MDRRKFIKVGSVAVAATAVSGNGIVSAAESLSGKKLKVHNPSGPAVWSSETGKAGEGDLFARFLGTGAADWNGVDEREEQRRLTSILFDNRIFIDFTETDADMLPKGFKSDAVFYTHSHGDHYNAAAEIKYIGASHVYVGATWVEKARKEFKKAAEIAGAECPEVTPLGIGTKVIVGDITVTAMPGNHYIDPEEQPLIYLVEKGDVRVIYATDTGGIPCKAARIAGIDAHDPNGKPVTALVMEATMGIDYDEDYRIFTHSSVGLVKRTTDVMMATGRLKAPQGQPVYLTHMARGLHGTQAELDRDLPEPLRAAYDGLEVVFRAQ